MMIIIIIKSLPTFPHHHYDLHIIQIDFRQFKLSTAESRESLRTLGSRQDLTQVIIWTIYQKMMMIIVMIITIIKIIIMLMMTMRTLGSRQDLT